MKRRKKRSCHSSSSSDEDDSDFDLKDEAFTLSPSPSPSPSPPPKKSQLKNVNHIQTRKKLALPKAPRSDRKKRKAETTMSVKRDEVDVFDSEDDGLPCTKIPTFEMLLEAASFHTDGGHPAQMNAPSSPANVGLHVKQETKFGECISEKETENNLMSEIEENNKEVDNYCVDDSDGLEKENKMDFMVSHAKKTRSRLASQQTSPISYSTNSTKATITIHDKNKALGISIDESQLTGHIKENHKDPSEPVVSKNKTCGKLGTPVSSKITRKFRTEAAGRRVPLGLPGTRTSLKSNTEPSSENNTSASSCSKVLQFQSSSAPHQRVIGLSRRVRPPPLHPYLSKTDK